MTDSRPGADGLPGVDAFDRQSGNLLERLIFNNRLPLVLISAVLTLFLGWNAASLSVAASFSRMLPVANPYIHNYLDNAASLRGLGNAITVVVENRGGDVYDPAYLETVRKLNDAIFLIPGVDQPFMKSLWTPLVRWTEITEEGMRGGPVMPDRFDGTPAQVAALRHNVAQAGLVGSLVANDLRSSVIVVPLLDRDAATGVPLDYAAFSHRLEAKIANVTAQEPSGNVRVHITGFAFLMGKLVDGVWQVLQYFTGAACIAAVIIFVFTRCLRSTVTILGCSLTAVVWQLGIIHLLGFALDPYSILVPFLVFAIGVSHGAQKMNGIMGDVGRGAHRYMAARFTFRRLFIAGLSALIADAMGFAVLMMIDIPAIRDLAVTASLGVLVLIFTNLVLLPVLLSYVGVSPRAARRSLHPDRAGRWSLALMLERCTSRRWALAILGGAAVLTGAGLAAGRSLQIGDLQAGAPELRPTSRYNLDVAYAAAHYGQSGDQFAVIVKTPEAGIVSYPALIEMDRLEQILRQLPGVRSTVSAASLVRPYTAGDFEGSPKWMTISRDPFVLRDAMNYLHVSNPELIDTSFSVAPIVAYLADHKARTLTTVSNAVAAFARDHDTPDRHFLLAAGSAGIEAATNDVVRAAYGRMLYLVYAAVIALCLFSFRSWRATIVAVVPLLITTILCEALMVVLGIGIKVSTLPVTALGVGIGVDYALYLLAIQLSFQRAGHPLHEAYAMAVRFTGKIVALVGITLAAGVALWAFSPVKFQADMGILLAFMFLWNMVGALVLIPALSHFLLRGSAACNAGLSGPDVAAGQTARPRPNALPPIKAATNYK